MTQEAVVAEGKELLNSRRRAREGAIQALYQCDTLGDCSEQAIDTFFRHFYPECIKPEAGNNYENYKFSSRLAVGVIEQIVAIDKEISGASSHWSVSRMARVDRNILRVAVFEMLFIPEIPFNVTINEAVEISKRYGCPDSSTFVNGVLDHIAKHLRAEQGEDVKKVVGS